MVLHNRVGENAIIKGSDKQFRLRISGSLRSIGVSQIIDTKEYLGIEFVGGKYSIRVPYPRKLDVVLANIGDIIAYRHGLHFICARK